VTLPWLASPFTRASLGIVVAMFGLLRPLTFAVAPVAHFFGFSQLEPSQWIAPVLSGSLVCAALELVNRVLATKVSAR
jgi:hypothetical protein